MKRIGIKYCGGCNSFYDRVGMVEKLARKLKGIAIFLSYEDFPYDLLLIVNGCMRACADREDIHALCPNWMSISEEVNGLEQDLILKLKKIEGGYDYDKDKGRLHKKP
jgi:hypothetical protein